MTDSRLSVLIVARDEERRLGACIRSAGFADEIVVLLDRSADGSAEIAGGLGARIVSGGWPDQGEGRMRAEGP